MKPSTFQTTIENQFDYICKRAMEDERKDYYKYLSRLSKHEISFSEVGDYIVSQFFTMDNRIETTDFQIHPLNGITVGIEHDLLSEALRELPERKREILLMYYFMNMSDSEIAELLKLNRSTVYRHRTSGLALIKKFMEGLEK
jgi:RNA polymerase sigma factor (sigma-70 family)